MPSPVSFEFELDPIGRIEPWGAASDPTLHWFGLSSGWYYIRVGDIELLRYSADVQARRVANNDTAYSGPYVDYQLARLHEDLLAILPSSAAPMPRDIATILRKKTLLHVASALAECAENRDLHDPALDELEHVFELHRDCYLDMHYLVQGQDIVFWSDGDELIAEWDSSERQSDGRSPTWVAGSGIRAVPRSEFISAVGAFHESLIRQMEERVVWLERSGGIPGARIDLAELRRDHERRAMGFANAIAALPKSRDWDAVRSALRKYLSA